MPRATEDIDILLLVGEKEKNRVLECIRESLVIELSHKRVVRFKGIALWRNLVKVNDGEAPVILDFIIADSDYLRMAVKRSVTINLYGFELRMISAEDLIIMKLLSNRPQDRLDIEGILATGRKIDSAYVRENASGLGIDVDLTFLP